MLQNLGIMQVATSIFLDAVLFAYFKSIIPYRDGGAYRDGGDIQLSNFFLMEWLLGAFGSSVFIS